MLSVFISAEASAFDLRSLVEIGNRQSTICKSHGVLAQLVERLNGIEEVRGSNPLGSTISRSETLNNEGMRTCSTGGARSARVTSEALELEPKRMLWIIP